MTIAIVIGTHGWAAEQLLKTAEMLLGEQENVGWIDFVPGENAETLIEKYNAQLAKLDTTKGVLFLVDTWGGSPFNAASRIVVDKEHYEVIAGVNIPMLVETLMARDDDPSFDELVALAVETGREGVKALKAKPVEKAAPAPAAAAPKAAPTPAKPMGPNDYMVIGLARDQGGRGSGCSAGSRRHHGRYLHPHRLPSDSRSGRHPLDQRNQCLPYYCC